MDTFMIQVQKEKTKKGQVKGEETADKRIR